MRSVIVLLIIAILPVLGFSKTIHVPGNFSAIQEAIKNALDGDTVLVAPDTYVENINFKGKAITVKSSGGSEVTIIDGGDPSNPQNGSVVRFKNGEGLTSIIEGFTLRNGSGAGVSGYREGGGISCSDGSSPTIVNNIVTDNETDSGGGIACSGGSAPLISNNLIFNNTSTKINFSGGGIYCTGSSPTITNNVIGGNIATKPPGHLSFSAGGGIDLVYWSSPLISNNIIISNTAEYGGGIMVHWECDPIIRNNLICGNKAVGGTHGDGSFGGGIGVADFSLPVISNNTITGNYCEYGGGVGIWQTEALITNNIIYGNYALNGPELALINVQGPSTMNIDYCDVKGGQADVYIDSGCTLNWGSGNIVADPCFCTGPKGFFYLSQLASGQPVDSPCVDAGSDLASNLGMDIYWTRTDGVTDSGTVDMGFHYGDFTFPALQIDRFFIPESTGGDSGFLLLAGSGNANRYYIILGSVSGTDVGITLPGGKAILPLNWDLFTNVVIEYINTPIFSNFMGTLDGTGSAMAMFDTLGPIVGAQGLTLHFGFALNNPWDTVSNPVGIEITP